LKITVQAFAVQAPGEFEDAFLTIVKRGFEAVVVGQDGMLTANIKTIAVKTRTVEQPIR